MKKRKVSFADPVRDAGKVRDVLEERGRAPFPPLPGKLKRSDSARRFWSERAWSEYAAVPAMAQTTLALVQAKSALTELGGIAQIAADEVRHAELSRDIAESLGGYVTDVPSGLLYDPHRLADPSSYGLPFWIVGGGCINETLSLELMKARLKHTREPSILAILSRIQKDEAVHTRLSWAIAEELIPKLPEGERRQLARYSADMVNALSCTFATFGLPPSVRRGARKIRTETAEAGLGACPPDEADAVFRDTVEKVLLPRLQKLSLPLG